MGWFTSSYDSIAKNDSSGIVYPLPVSGPVGYTLAGQDIFPVYNNRGTLTPEQCEADGCNQHVGREGGQPHLHGDPFGPTCFYSAANYSSLAAHPPLIGYAVDGHGIFGRHLSESAPGYSDTLDVCGGHSHGAYGYHYHAQVVNATTDTIAAQGVRPGLSFPVGTPGVYQCFRGNLSADPYLNVRFNVPDAACCGSTAAYVKAGFTFNPAAKGPGAAQPTATPSATMTPAAPVTNAVTFNSLPPEAVNATSGALTAAAVAVLKTALETAVKSVCAACAVTVTKVVDSSSGKTLYAARRLQTTYSVTVTFATSGANAAALAAVTAASATAAFTAAATTAVQNAGYSSATVAAVTTANNSTSATNQSVAIGVGVGVGVGGTIALLVGLWYFGFFAKAPPKTADTAAA